MKKYISQKGEDGFGHQILGMMSIIALTKEFNEYEYVPYKHDGKFEHVDSDEKEILKMFFGKMYELLGYDLNVDFEKYPTKRIMSRMKNNYNFNEFNNLEWEKYSYVFDNCWSLKNSGNILYKHRDSLRKSVLNEYLPIPNKFNNKVNVVIHIRGGDGSTRQFSERTLNIRNLNSFIRNIENIYSNKCYFHVHTNSNGKLRESEIFMGLRGEYKIYGKEIPILQVFSDMIHSDVLLIGDSSLSIAASYLSENVKYCPSKLTCAEGKDIGINPLISVKAKRYEDNLM